MEYGFVVREYLDFKQTMPHSQGLRSYGVMELRSYGVKELWS